jgi:Protein of unknown function DUF262
MTEQTTGGYVTSYAGLFRSQPDGSPGIAKIEIPLIQRDYAQGRRDPRVDEIRDRFLTDLHRAVITGRSLSLDFVYGEIDANRKLQPLDGQQRLTTLFLLHWYLANRVGRLDQEAGWKQFSYATRDGARQFCERLSSAEAPVDTATLSDWIVDQAWYRYLWRHDPTIQSMLVMIDAIRAAFVNDGDDTCLAAWIRLVDPDEPAISFHLLPIEAMGSGSELYIKMNSRGKPLTEFENFKARFERAVQWSGKKEILAANLDGAWSDLLWKISRDSIVDDEFVNYIGFITEVCEWIQGDDDVKTGRLDPRAEQVFGTKNEQRAQHLDFLFQAFNTWLDEKGLPVDVDAAFKEFFTVDGGAGTPGADGKLMLFGKNNVNLFMACCHTYGVMSGKARVFTIGDGLLLYAVLLHRIHGTEDLPRRLRALRNLVEASTNELRPSSGPLHSADVRHLVVDGTLDKVSSLNQRQVKDEQRKRIFLATNPELEPVLFRLEDHELLRGRLASFSLDAATLKQRALAFERLMNDPRHWPTLTAALLTRGDYGRNMANGYLRLGSPDTASWWRELLTEANDADTARTSAALGTLLDDLATEEGSIADRLSAMRDEWLEVRAGQQLFDWRYYLVRYDAMREGRTGIYYSPSGSMGYSLCMLSTKSIQGYYRDPYLFAMWRASEVDGAVDEPIFRFDVPRWMRLKASGTELRVMDERMEIQPPENEAQRATLKALLEGREHVVESDGTYFLVMPQANRGGVLIDTTDRVQLGVELLRDLVAAGF